MKVFRLLTMFIFLSRLLAAQSPTPPALPPATGSVTGHVFLGDSHLPARMASVTLLPVVSSNAASGLQVDYFNFHVRVGKSPGGEHYSPTQFDGSFVIRDVIPGSYYVFAEKEGYVSPIHPPNGTVDS